MNWFRRSKADASFQVEIPPEMREGWSAGGTIAPRISRAEALQVPAVLRSRNLIAGTLARLPIHVRDRERRIAPPTTLLNQIDPDLPNIVTFAQTFEDLLFEGVSWWRVTAFGWHDYPVSAQHIGVDRVNVQGCGPPANGQWPTTGPARVYVDGLPVSDGELIRFDSPNPPLLVHAARAIRSCLELDRAASRYSNYPYPLGYFTPREGVRPKEDPDAIEEMLDRWEQGRRHHVWGYIGAAWEGKQFQFDADQIQLHEQRRQDLIDFTLAPYMTAVEERLSMHDVLPRGYEAKFNLDGFLRADTLGRFQAHKIALDSGFETVEEVRALEDLPPLQPNL